MRDKMYYINSHNEIINFGDKPYYINMNDLRDYKWNYDSNNDKISRFKRGMVEKTIPCFVLGDASVKNKLYEVFERDIILKKPGRLYIGDYYYNCYVIASKKSEYTNSYDYMKIDLTLISEENIWYKETLNSYVKDNTDIPLSNLKEYSFDYSYGYLEDGSSRELVNNAINESGFKINIYGKCVNPKITIGSNEYSVNTTIEEGEYLTITSIGKQKTVIKTKVNGVKINEFNNRNKENSVFTKVKEGVNVVAWNGSFSFDIVLLEERSEPKWI